VAEVPRTKTKVPQVRGVSQKTRSTFVLTRPNEILYALVGLIDVSVRITKRTGRRAYVGQLRGQLKHKA